MFLITSTPGRLAKYWGQRVCMYVCLFVCLFVCLTVCLSVCSHISTIACPNLPNFLCMLAVAVTRSISDDSVTSYVNFRFCGNFYHIMGPIGKSQAWRYVWLSSPDGGNGGEVAVYDLIFDCCCWQIKRLIWWLIDYDNACKHPEVKSSLKRFPVAVKTF